jgi:endonuclease/exonuclease/phosphatase family metal-dependent hydrolase
MPEFRVATWNVQNLFVAGADDGPETQSQFAAKIASLADVIDRMEPDAIALQEVGTEPALVALQEALAHPMPHRLLGVPDDRGIRVALLATSPLSDRIDVRPFPDGLLPVQCGDDPVGAEGPRTMNQMGRGGLQASVNVGGREVRVISCHLKSKLLTFPGGRFSPRDERG